MKVVLMGEPNVGKSSLLNALIDEPVSIVTDLRGTTRNAISGFLQDIEIVDTPGMQAKHTDGALGKNMRKSISTAVANADTIVYVLDATNFSDRDIQKISNYRGKQQSIIVAVNKADKTNFEKLYPRLANLNELDFVTAIIPVSAKTGFNIDALLKEISIAAPTQTSADDDNFTDQTVRQMCAEIIRAALINNLHAEIPHSVAVLITKFTENQKETEIHADIICEKTSQKPIIIGKKGETLKKIGTMARAEIEKLTQNHVKLFTTVIVREDWKNNKEILAQLGHTIN